MEKQTTLASELVTVCKGGHLRGTTGDRSYDPSSYFYIIS